MIIAIDGPAGAGKSTVARELTRELGFQLIDTGALYRAVAYEAMQQGVALEDAEAVAALASQLELEFRMEGNENVLYCGGEPLRQEIRSAGVSRGASIVSAHPEVRAALLSLQRELGHRHSSVLDGRDIGTVVFPDAELKVFITASPQTRARRRVEQMAEQGIEAIFDDVLDEIIARDRRDMERDIAPLRKSEEAIEIDSTQRTVADIVEELAEAARCIQASHRSD